jgi:predicted esterase
VLGLVAGFVGGLGAALAFAGLGAEGFSAADLAAAASVVRPASRASAAASGGVAGATGLGVLAGGGALAVEGGAAVVTGTALGGAAGASPPKIFSRKTIAPTPAARITTQKAALGPLLFVGAGADARATLRAGLAAAGFAAGSGVLSAGAFFAGAAALSVGGGDGAASAGSAPDGSGSSPSCAGSPPAPMPRTVRSRAGTSAAAGDSGGGGWPIPSSVFSRVSGAAGGLPGLSALSALSSDMAAMVAKVPSIRPELEDSRGSETPKKLGRIARRRSVNAANAEGSEATMRAIVTGIAALLLLGAAGCSGSSSSVDASSSGSSGSSSGGDGGGTSSGSTGSSGGTSSSGSTGSSGGTSSSGGAPDAGQVSDAGAGDGGASAPSVPKPVGACPTFKNGNVTFNPAAGPRTVQLYLNPSTLSKHGPLVLYWYATFGSPAEATQALGTAMQTLQALGGIVAAPADNGTGQFPWIDNVDAHMLLADEIVGCAAAAGVDTMRVHALGFSAGALMTTQLAFGRSAYLASVATYSGGLIDATVPAYESPSNKFAALILTGGASDNVFNTDFQKASQVFQAKLKGDGHSALYCDHGGGHAIPTAYTAAVGQFFLDHPFGTNPSPYVGALPAALKSCTF